MFRVFYGNQGLCIWMLKLEAFEKKYLKGSVKFLTFVMVWGCMTAQDPGKLCTVFMRGQFRSLSKKY